MDKSDKLIRMQYIINEAVKKQGNTKIKYGMEYVARKSTGSVYFDYLLSGGFEPATIAIYTGQASTGKSSMGLRNIAEAQRRGDTCAWIRVEKGFNRQYMENLGINVDELLIIEGIKYGEDYLDILVDLVEDEIDMIVVDSISGIIPKRVQENPLEKESPGVQAKMLTTMLGKLNSINKSSIIILISQVRQAFTTGYVKYNFSGGFAAQHYADYILEFRLKERLSDDLKEVGSKVLKTEDKKDVTGVNMLIYTHKCRRGSAHKVGEMYYNFETGKIDEIGELIKVSVKLGILDYAKGWIRLTDEFKELWELPSNNIRHKDLKGMVTTNQELHDFLIEEVVKRYD